MELRKYLQLSKSNMHRFSKLSGIEPRTLYGIINGRNEPRLKTILKIEHYTNGQVTIYDLKKYFEESHPKN